MNLKIYTADGSKSTNKKFSVPEFEGAKGRQALRQVLLAVRANKRQGNAHTKTRDEVSGTGRKPWRQKGTGMARHGSRRSPIWRGGGVAFGPRNRDYRQKINKKMRNMALCRIIFERASAGDIDVIESWEVKEPKTRIINSVIERIVPDGKVLIVDDSWSDNVLLAARNIERVSIINAATVSALDLSLYDKIIISREGMDKVLSRAAGDSQS